MDKYCYLYEYDYGYYKMALIMERKMRMKLIGRWHEKQNYHYMNPIYFKYRIKIQNAKTQELTEIYKSQRMSALN